MRSGATKPLSCIQLLKSKEVVRAAICCKACSGGYKSLGEITGICFSSIVLMLIHIHCDRLHCVQWFANEKNNVTSVELKQLEVNFYSNT